LLFHKSVFINYSSVLPYSMVCHQNCRGILSKPILPAGQGKPHPTWVKERTFAADYTMGKRAGKLKSLRDLAESGVVSVAETITFEAKL
jgi:hypothetical protein